MSFVNRTRPVMTVHMLVVPGNARCFSGLKTTLIRPVGFNSSGVVSTQWVVVDWFVPDLNDLCRQQDIQMTLTSLYHFLVASTRAHCSLYSTMSTYSQYGNFLYCTKRDPSHSTVELNEVVLHGIVSFQYRQSSESGECSKHASESKRLITTR